VRDDERRRLEAALRRALGAEILGALADPEVTDIQRNPDGRIWFAGSRGRYPSEIAITDEQTEALLGIIAGLHQLELTRDRPSVAVELPFSGERLQGLIPPAVARPAFAIRKRPTKVYSLDDYVAAGVMKEQQREVIRGLVAERRNIIVTGGAGTGKTTLVNAILREIVEAAEPGTRFVVIEDAVELQCAAENQVGLRTSPGVSLRALVQHTLRLDVDRVIVGEVRGAEAFEMLKVWNTGHPGNCATMHANSAGAAAARLDHLAQEAGVPSQAYEIGESRLVFVHLEGRGRARRVRELLAIEGYENGRYETRDLGVE